MLNEVYILAEGEIDQVFTHRLITAILNAKEIGAQKIIIFFSSLGGSIYHGFVLASVIQNSEVPIEMHATNHIDSIANVIYLSAPERTAESHAKFYMHGASTSAFAMNEPTLKDQLSSIQTHNHRIAQFVSENCGVPLNRVKGLMAKGSSLSAQEALKHKIVHRIAHRKITKIPIQQIIHLDGVKII